MTVHKIRLGDLDNEHKCYLTIGGVTINSMNIQLDLSQIVRHYQHICTLHKAELERLEKENKKLREPERLPGGSHPLLG